ncbi:hypothetical protein RJ639_001679, partial [Escallonia herrerae]
ENAPIFAYFGEEGPIDEDLPIIGLLNDNAPRFKALIIYIEHRFYGKSVPFGTLDEVINNENTRGYFSSAQAIADYAEVLVYLKEKLSAKIHRLSSLEDHMGEVSDSKQLYASLSFGEFDKSRQSGQAVLPAAVYGGTNLKLDGDSLSLDDDSAWLLMTTVCSGRRMIDGALIGFAPGVVRLLTEWLSALRLFDLAGVASGCDVGELVGEEASESCYETIRNSWSVIDEVATRPNGLSFLSQRFKTCSPLDTSLELKDYLDTMYAVAAQYNHPPTYPVTVVCGSIDGAPDGTDILGRIFAGVVAYGGERSCYEMKKSNSASQTNLGWSWQTCSELVMPIGRGSNDTMFPSAPFSLNDFTNSCMSKYGVPPRPRWVTTYYGSHDIKLVLQRFASNIIFSNGLRDPYSSGGVLEKISDSVLPIYTVNGSHCLDILTSSQGDPQWLVMQRQVEIEIIRGWFAKYYADLHALQI